MNIHLITYLTSKLFWIYTVFRYNTILYPKDEDTQKLFAYFCAYLLSCWGSMQWGTMYGDLIFELIALLIITVAYQADWQHHVWNTLMVYIMGILCDSNRVLSTVCGSKKSGTSSHGTGNYRNGKFYILFTGSHY